MAKRDLRLRRQLDETAFHRLLQWLDQGSDSQGERYVEIRDRLMIYFGRRNCPAPEDLADETLNRVARRLEEQVSIDDIGPCSLLLHRRKVRTAGISQAAQSRGHLLERHSSGRAPDTSA